MASTFTEGINESAPLRSTTAPSPYLPVAQAGRAFGTTYFLISVLLASVIPIIQLVIGVRYNGDCPIDQRIPTYMIVAGIFGLVLVALSVFLALTFLCFIADSTALTIIASCAICLNVLLTILISIFVFIWFICGCVWVFNVTNSVQFEHPSKKESYCNPVLYKWTFAILIVTIVWAAIQCCLSCFRNCCVGRNA